MEIQSIKIVEWIAVFDTIISRLEVLRETEQQFIRQLESLRTSDDSISQEYLKQMLRQRGLNLKECGTCVDLFKQCNSRYGVLGVSRETHLVLDGCKTSLESLYSYFEGLHCLFDEIIQEFAESNPSENHIDLSKKVRIVKYYFKFSSLSNHADILQNTLQYCKNVRSQMLLSKRVLEERSDEPRPRFIDS